MARYIETGTNFNKAELIQERFRAIEVSDAEARFMLEEEPEQAAVIVVVENPHFEAAAFADTLAEYERFCDPDDHRPKTILLSADRELCERWAGNPRAYIPEEATA